MIDNQPPAMRTIFWTVSLLLTLFIAIAFFYAVGTVLFGLFGAILLAVILSALASPIATRTGLPHWAAVASVILLGAGILAGGGLLLGPQITVQLASLGDAIPESLATLKGWAEGVEWLAPVVAQVPSPEELVTKGGEQVGKLSDMLIAFTQGVGNLVMILLIGFYLALSPAVYRQSAFKLLPKAYRQRSAQVVDLTGKALRSWLMGMLVTMTAVGILTSLGLKLLGVPLPLALGLIAGIFSFVPFIGPLAAGVPALLIAVTFEPTLGLFVIGLFFGVQFLEGNVITPLVTMRAVDLPPVGLLTAQLLFGTVFGLPGLFLAAPFTVVLIVAIQTIYVEDVLGDDAPVLGTVKKKSPLDWWREWRRG